MNRSISATEASRRFSEVLRRVREGHSYVERWRRDDLYECLIEK